MSQTNPEPSAGEVGIHADTKITLNDARQLHLLLDRAAVIEVIVAIANAMDAKNWARLKSCLAPEIDVDYSEFRGEPPSRVTSDAYVEARRKALVDLRTLHISTNHQVDLAGDEATCVSAYVIYRLDPRAASGTNRLDSVGNYTHRLAKTRDGWKVTQIVQTVICLEGNRSIHGALR